ncbi:SIR2 family protein [Cronobacter malonaticus]
MFTRDIELFIKSYVEDITAGTAAIFAGAGLSIPAGFVSWKELIRDIAYELELDVDKETDLVSIAQFHLNEKRNRSAINKKIINEFSIQAKETENHKIIARLPIKTIWTTNYDNVIETSYSNINKVCDVKVSPNDITSSIHKRDVVLYKMHGDSKSPSEAILTKAQYESYYHTHAPFINTLTGDLTTKTFLFIGFSFEDPNLQYILSRLYVQYEENAKSHYCIMRKVQLGDRGNESKADFDYNKRKQILMINDLKRYGIQTLEVDDYSEVTAILKAVEREVKKGTIFISGSADIYTPYQQDDAVKFIHRLSKGFILRNYRVVNGFGWGVGTSVINGALEAIYDSQGKISESQLIMRPFPQFATGGTTIKALWHEYRQRMISLSGITIFIFGNKKSNEGNIIEANGVFDEFEISINNGSTCIPIGCTGFASKKIFEIIEKKPMDIYIRNPAAMELLKKLNEGGGLINKEEYVFQLLAIIDKDKHHD